MNPRAERATGRWFASGLAGFALVWLCGCASLPPERWAGYEFTRAQMGLPFRIVLYAPDDATARRAADAAYARIRQLNAIMSDYEPESELSRLSGSSGQGRAVKVSEDLWRVLERAQEFSQRSDGAFDITVGPVVGLWRKARRTRTLPAADELSVARAHMGWRKLRLDATNHTAELLAPGMKLDLGAIAKGYAADEALKVLRAHGITRALVSGGGDMAAGDAPPGRRGWRIELAPLDTEGSETTNFVLIANCGLATSGDAFQRLEIAGQRYSHIVDPRTGVGLTDHSLVVVIARDGMTADGLSTAVSVLGPERGMTLVAATTGAEARIVRQPATGREVRESAGFRRFLDAPAP